MIAGKMLGRTGLRLSPFGAALNARSGASPMSSLAEPPNFCDVPAEVAPDAWAQLVGLLEGQWSLALSAWTESADQSEASSAVGGEPAEGRGSPLSASAVSPNDDVHRPDFFLMVRVGPEHWDRSMARAVEQTLWRTGQPHVDLLQLEPFDLERIKAGEPFRRLEELRDAGRVRFFGVVVDNLRDARWVLEQTPAHAVTVNAPRQAPCWAELFDAANETDSGLLATPAAADNDPDAARRILTDTPITAFSWPADIA
jgi:hypothetical protein